MTPLHFHKMHALGNDFIVINNLNLNFHATPQQIQTLGNRHLGIGFDQALIIEPSNKADVFCRILNTDGSEAEQCGNGLRCVALYLKTHHAHSNQCVIETKAGFFPVRFCDDDTLEINMGKPQSDVVQVNLALRDNTVTAHTVSMGNPHCIITVANIDAAPMLTLGAELNEHTHFPEGVNVGFLEIIHPQHAKLRTFERGAGPTLACGSNACAAAAVGIQTGLLISPVTIDFKYGSLTLTEKDSEIYMKGPANFVFEGKVI